VGSPCPNCAAPLAGAWCHACGQSAEEFHRSFLRLTVEAFAGLFDFDSRVWRTLPRLVVGPGQMTRDYLDGQRASQVPPFRMFLIVIVLIFLAASTFPGDPKNNIVVQPVVGLGVAPGSKATVDSDWTKWVKARLLLSTQHHEAFEASLTSWAQRLAVVALPISALLLGLTFFWRRDIFMFDHLIFSMHSLTFQGVLISSLMLLGRLSDWAWVLLVAAPTHLFVHLRGAYGIGVFGALTRMAILLAGSVAAFMVLMSGLVLIGLYEIGS
jgi:hypothetical protein